MFKKFDHNETAQVDEIAYRLPENGLCCANCLAFITEPDSMLKIQGSHQHTCTNPAQRTFTLGCFGDAPGCTHTGVPTDDHTWFAGYRWCIALCRQCKNHLGWSFLGTGNRFYGLILAELVEK